MDSEVTPSGFRIRSIPGVTELLVAVELEAVAVVEPAVVVDLAVLAEAVGSQ